MLARILGGVVVKVPGMMILVNCHPEFESSSKNKIIFCLIFFTNSIHFGLIVKVKTFHMTLIWYWFALAPDTTVPAKTNYFFPSVFQL